MRPIAALSYILFVAPLVAQHAIAHLTTGQLRDRVQIGHGAGLQAAAEGPDLVGLGTRYGVRFSAQGMRMEPVLGRVVAATQHLMLTPVSVRRGEVQVLSLPSQATPVRDERTASYRHAPGVIERYDVQPDAVELSWTFERPLPGSGDLVVRYAIDTGLGSPTGSADGLTFSARAIDGSDGGGVHIGGVTGIDARGRRVNGGLRHVGGQLELSLPAAFVDDAAYPLVLDPAIGPVVSVSQGSGTADLPDTAYDPNSSRHLVVWQRAVSGGQSVVTGQLVEFGVVLGPLINFGGTGSVGRPRVANLNQLSRFAVTWVNEHPTGCTLRLAIVNSASGQITHAGSAATGATNAFSDADIGCESGAVIGTPRAYVLSYRDRQAGTILARRAYFDALDQLLVTAAITVFSNSSLGGLTYTQPAISRGASADGRLLVVARRRTAATGTTQIRAAVVHSDSQVLGPTLTIVNSPTEDVSYPDVDGYGGHWVVAWQESVGSTHSTVKACPIELAASGSSISAGTIVTFGGPQTLQTAPVVGYTPGRSWIGYHRDSTSVPQGLKLECIDSASGTSCFDDVLLTGGPVGLPLAIGTAAAAGQASAETALAVWGNSGDIFAQRLRSYGTGGAIGNLGGGCGSGGTPGFSHLPSIGSGGLVCSVSLLPPSALVTVFNFGPVANTISCGACVWSPFAITAILPVTGGGAAVEFPIPGLSVLVGSVFETQWTTLDPLQAPCSLLPGFVLSPRTLLTIGS